MAAIDPSTNLGRLRLRCADFGDIPYLPDAVYSQTLADCKDNLPQAAKTCATYILGMLSFKTHRKLSQLEVWGSEAFTHYKEYLLLIVKDPSFMDISPIAPNLAGTTLHPLMQFTSDWNQNWAQTTQSQQLAWDAFGSPSSTNVWEWPQ